MVRHWLRRLAPLGCIVGFACLAPPVEAPDNRLREETRLSVSQNPSNKVDILFMVDNSFSMDAMQGELQTQLGEFFSVFDDAVTDGVHPDLHIGVVTSDYGAGHEAHQINETQKCDASPGGQGGQLQTKSLAVSTACPPPVGVPYIRYRYLPDGGVESNLPAEWALSDEFRCLASVGASGCGFEHQLESVYAALLDSKRRGANGDFLREDARLAVVFLTNEDDGSADPMSNIYSPDDKDVSQFGLYDTYRQTRFAVACGEPSIMPPYGPSGLLDDCIAAPNGQAAKDRAYDVSRYIDFFTKPASSGGIKDVPDDVILIAIDAPLTPFEVILTDRDSGTGTGKWPAYHECPSPMVSDQCRVRLNHSCQHPKVPAFFGDPPVRLEQVVRSVGQHYSYSICGDPRADKPSYRETLREVARKINDGGDDGCIPEPLTTPADPECNVDEYVYAATGVEEHGLPRCDATTSQRPCWKLESKASCAMRSPDGLGLTVVRDGMAAPHTRDRVFCATRPTTTPATMALRQP